MTAWVAVGLIGGGTAFASRLCSLSRLIGAGMIVAGGVVLAAAGLRRLGRIEEAGEVVSAAAALAYDGDQQVAVLVSQRMLGRKKWLESK